MTTDLDRPSFASIYMGLAVDLSRRSTCSRLSVGCVVASPDWRYVYGVGYNGGVAGVSHSWHGNVCTGEQGMCGCLHAEENAIINCNASRSDSKVVLVTHFPCRQCAARLINMGGVEKVYFEDEYRDSDPSKELLDRVGIEFERIRYD